MSASIHKRKTSDELPLLNAGEDKYHKGGGDVAPRVESYLGAGRQIGQSMATYDMASQYSWKRVRV